MTELNDTTAAHVRVRVLARYAALPLAPEREVLVAAILDAWIPAADELSRKMSTGAHQTLLPITLLTHVADIGDDSP